LIYIVCEAQKIATRRREVLVHFYPCFLCGWDATSI